MNLLLNFYFCACVLVCMFHSLVPTMASNIQPEEDKPIHPAGTNTNTFINQNQTLADIIPDRNLGPLASLKIKDADLIIHNLNSQLNAAVEKNDQSTALLRRMDQCQKEIKTELAALRAEKEATIQKKWDHTINQERLAENIRDNLEKEYADKEQNYLWQLKQEM